MTHPRRSLCTPSAGTAGRTCPGGLLRPRRRRRLCRCRGRSEGTPRGGDTHRSRSRPARRRRPPRPCGRHGAGGERGRRTPARLCSRCPPAAPRYRGPLLPGGSGQPGGPGQRQRGLTWGPRTRRKRRAGPRGGSSSRCRGWRRTCRTRPRCPWYGCRGAGSPRRCGSRCCRPGRG